MDYAHLKNYIYFLMLAGLLSGPVVADELDLSDDFGLDEDLFFSDDLEFESEETKSLWWNQLFAFSVEESAGWSSNQDAMYLHQTLATAKWSDSLTPELYAELDVSAIVDWDRTDLTGNSLRQESDFNINTGYLQASVGPVSGKIGKYAIGWGELEGAGIIDVINPSPDPTKGELGGLGSSQWLVSGQLYTANYDVSVFYNLEPEFTDLGIQLPKTTDPEFGFKLNTSITGSDIAIYVAQLYEDTPNPDLANFSFASLNNYQLIGISANKATGNWLFKSDIAYKQGVSLYSGNVPTAVIKRYDRLDYGLGFELNSPDGRQLTASVFAQSWQNLDGQSGKLVPFPTPSIQVVGNTEASALIMYTDNYLNDDVSLTLMSTGALNGEILMASAQLGYQLNDHWKASFQYTIARADQNSIYAAFDGEQLILGSLIWNN